MKLFCRIISTGLGVGYFPFAPGTMGALVILILFWIVPALTPFQLIVVVFALSALGIFTATVTEKEISEKLGSTKGKDPGIIVIDEIVGMLVALIFVPKTISFLIIAFILFRIFDITKPFPIRRIEKLYSGWGIVFDDIAAGIYANLIIQLGRLIF